MKENIMEQRKKEIRKAMTDLGFGKGTVELRMLDDIRAKIVYDGYINVGIYDFVKHTFVD